MNEPLPEREQLWNEFLSKWPITRLEAMTLPEFSTAGDKECFMNWLEARTTPLGSIWGGSAFKFGVYGRKDKSPKPPKKGMTYGTDYAWATKYGATPEDAFAKVRQEVVAIAKAARIGDLQAVDQADLGPATKWKIAFLYQDRQRPKIVNIFTFDQLRKVTGIGKQISVPALQAQIMGALGEKHVLTLGDDIWKKIEDLEAQQLTKDAALEYLRSLDNYQPVKEPTEKMAGFYVTETGSQLALALDNKAPTFYLSPGTWMQQIGPHASSITEYGAAKSRSSSIDANAPALATGNPAVKVKLRDLAGLRLLAHLYAGDDLSDEVPAATPALAITPERIPLNQIFYGPPGTGKTFRTVDEAVRIVDPAFFAANKGNRLELKRRFDELVQGRQVQFVTFHQSFSYEDFVEGLRPLPSDAGGLRYEVVDGVFKSLCASADIQVTRREEAPPEVAKRTIWKMSLGNTQMDEDEIYEECIDGGYALLGWGESIDFTGCKSVEDIHKRFHEEGAGAKGSADYAVSSVATFMLQVKKGDLVVVTEGNFKFRAIGEVTGDYEYAPRTAEWHGYAQKRRVRWLRVYQPALPYGELMNNQFVQRTIYRLKPGSIDLNKLERLLTSPPPGQAKAAPADDANSRRVLIIDEINRGNVSRIFGELITLLEESKRKGSAEALEVLLPYSKKPFSVPNNVYLIGTMNTADRSLTGLDIALRRRFSFVELPPDYIRLQGVVIEDAIDLGELLQAINARIEILLDRDHCIGHAYFLHLKNDSALSELADVFRRQILPLLQEYFFEDWGRIRLVLNDHRKANPQHRFLKQPAMSAELLVGDSAPTAGDDKRWQLNDGAFSFVESYVGTVGKSLG